MEPRGKVAVVTGGGSGIGRALALELADQGAAGVTVADLDGERAEAVAGEIGDRALAVGCDVSDEAAIAELLERTEAAFGPADLYCANAGVAVGADLGSEPDWDLAFAVNIRAHIRAARLLVPGWLERGEGYFLTTASAAGLLTQIGSAPYAVTKHGAVAFAEWLSIAYGDRGIRVSCLCPQGVNTRMLHPEGEDAVDEIAARVVAGVGRVLEPEEVAAVVVDALREERFLILPHPEVLDYFRRKASDYDRWLAGMRRLQAALAEG
jgi:NAD(P)-dependent dehydrogenase (short-subunit alcohol dehydrogenase family)